MVLLKFKVMGLGYVGLTLALTLADRGYKVVGVDIDQQKIEKLRSGKPTFYEPQLDLLLNSTISSGNISFSNKLEKDDEETTFIICVNTPLDESTYQPKLDSLKNVCNEIGENIKKNDLLINRSTVPIRTTRDIIKTIVENKSGLKAGVDFSLACAPERTLQGAALQELRQLSQVVGGIDEDSIDRTANIFNKLTRIIVRVSSLEAAELIKLIDNTYRDITISIGNLYGKICEKLNLDAREVISAANFGYQRNKILYPGAGVGGGCLTKDPFLLLSSLGNELNLDLIRTSRKINDSMIEDTKKLIKSSFDKSSKKLANSKTLILGFAFKGVPETDDIRFSPTIPIIKFLKEQNAILFGFDTAVPAETIQSLDVTPIPEIYSDTFDCVIILNNNPKFRNLDFKRLENDSTKPLLVIDGWYMYDSESVNKLGINYFALGSKSN